MNYYPNQAFYHTYLDINGRVAIPKFLREKLNLKKLDNLVLTLDGDTVQMHTSNKKIQEARKLVKRYCSNANLAADLAKVRREEDKHD